MQETWIHWARANFDKFVIVLMWAWWMYVVIHAPVPDPAEAMHWYRENMNTVQGAVIGLLTGAMLSGRKEAPPNTTAQITETKQTTIQEAEPKAAE
jgi:fructose-specific phosphotransferase system IIC component